MAITACPVCKYDLGVPVKELVTDSLFFSCARCGDFILTRSLFASSDLLKAPDYLLSAWIRDKKVNGSNPPTITTSSIEIIRNQIRKYSTSEKQYLLLKIIEKETKYPSSTVLINIYTDFVRCWATAPDELRYYLDALAKRDLISWGGNIQNGVYASITPKGWEYLESRIVEQKDKRQAFVAMSFSREMDSVWENALKPGIEASGYTPYRIDKIPHNERIDVKIMSEIKNSRFLVAEFTGHKHGVYFEAGYAIGLGIPVIWCINKMDLGEVHFDTRQYNHIVWETAEALRVDLQSYIDVIIGVEKC